MSSQQNPVPISAQYLLRVRTAYLTDSARCFPPLVPDYPNNAIRKPWRRWRWYDRGCQMIYPCIGSMMTAFKFSHGRRGRIVVLVEGDSKFEGRIKHVNGMVEKMIDRGCMHERRGLIPRTSQTPFRADWQSSVSPQRGGLNT